MTINPTHDPARRSWVESANTDATDFPIQNLPLGVFSRAGREEDRRCGVAIGDQVLDLVEAARQGLLEGFAVDDFTGPLNRLMAQSPDRWRALRALVSDLLSAEGAAGVRGRARQGEILVRQDAVTMHLPADVGDYTDFYASVYHATNVGSMFRPDNPLLPNYKWVPIGYHGRASSIVPSGTAVRRPVGQVSANPAGPPTVGPTARLDYEVELGAWIGGANALGATVPIARAGERVFGVSLLNDWSARDMQAWEYQPLGPFLAKNFASSVSPWVVTAEALAPFRTPAFARPEGDPAPLPYLFDAGDQASGGLAIAVECWLASAGMRAAGIAPMRVSLGSARDLYWTFAQMVAHHASNGCNLKPGDLLGSGTVSGAEKGSRGCLLELTWRGTEPITLPTGEVRSFLADGDAVTLRASASAPGYRTIGFGECAGVILPATGQE
ncbi:MAG: fumarylacetoacetase [Gemmatimonadetes bacterium]|nr:fumarylacetoacetase [Gemmatimonadota bacterium]